MNKKPTISKWEEVEVLRSSIEAESKAEMNLLIDKAVISRYRAPNSETPFPLEFAYHLLGDASGKVVLDYGCGSGENSVLVADHGAEVIGIDISPELISLAEKRMELHSPLKAEFRIGSAHDLPIEPESIDIVFGMAILHHLDLDLASNAVFQVLKPGGRAIFLEPVRNSRLFSFIRKMIPYRAPDVSPYERPLTDLELQKFGQQYSRYRSRAFHLPFVNLVSVLKLGEPILFSLIRLDSRILNLFPFLKYYATVRVIELVK